MATRVRNLPDLAYDQDGFAWAQAQAALLRARRFADLDLEHLIEEVEDLAASRLRTVRSRTRTMLRHSLKLAHSASTEPKLGWRETVRTQRADLADDLTPTLRQRLHSELGDIHAQARGLAAADLADHDEAAAAQQLPLACPYQLAQILDEDWPPP